MADGTSSKAKIKYIAFFKTASWREKRTKERRNTRRACLFYWRLAILFIIFCVSAAGGTYLWVTDIYSNIVLDRLVLGNDTEAFERWSRSPVQPLFRVKLFNYTNANDFWYKRDSKMRLQEVGPYTYRTQLERVNHIFHSNGSVTYQEKKTYVFVPELSVGNPKTDIIIGPNVPYIAAVSQVSNYNFFMQLSFAALVQTINAKPFISATVDQLLWGYSDPFIEMARLTSFLNNGPVLNKFGFFAEVNGTDTTRYTIGTGADGIYTLGKITHMNGNDKLRHWNSESCNKIDGTDGSIFPPAEITPNTTLYVYSKGVCRKMPMIFKEHSQVNGNIPTLRFHPPRNVFARSDENPSNKCFCNSETTSCPPSGVFNVSLCYNGAPVFISFPHFYLGNNSLQTPFTGLKPDGSLHDSYFDIYPKLGITLNVWSRLQINIRVKKAKHTTDLESFNDNTVLPILWFEVGTDKLPNEVLNTFLHLTYSFRVLHLFFLYSLPIIAIISLLILYRQVKSNNKKHNAVTFEAA